jgi:ABC-type sugar transport system ATPase subunit
LPYIELRNIEKEYPNGYKASDKISLSIERGEFVVLVGPSGCGKSTLLRLIAGLEDITKGELSIDGKVTNDLEPKERGIGMVFQNYALYPHLTIRDNLAFPLKIKKIEKNEIEQRVKDVAERLDLTSQLDKKPKELSGGQRQRVALGRALIKQPAIFLFDEPLSNLDAKLRVSMRTEITRIHRLAKATSVYVTHDQTEAMTMADRIAILNKGHLLQYDTPEVLYNQPVNKFVAEFLGSPQINMFSGEIIGGIFKEDNSNIDFKVNSKFEGKVLLGIRPENLYLSKEGILVEIDNLEYLGNEVIIYFNSNSLKRAVRHDIHKNSHFNHKIGETINIAYQTDKILLFNSTTEEIIKE